MAAPLLELRHVTKRFGGLMANQDVSFNVSAGEIIGLIGPNGAGKTTLFNCIAGFHVASEGEIMFCGESLLGLASEVIAARGSAQTLQIVRIFGSLSVVENVSRPC